MMSIIQIVKTHKRPLILLALAGCFIVWAPTIYANLSSRSDRYDSNKTSIKQVPHNKVAIVFGAGIYTDGSPTPYLQWRVETAVKLYKAGRVQKLLMTGDNSRKGYDEPAAMQKLALKLGVKPSDIYLDDAGRNTYDSCYRAHAIFKLDQATLVTQGYHLPRAILACDGLGVKSIGVDAIHTSRDWSLSYTVREWISTDKIVLQLIFKPHPAVLGMPLPIH